MGANAGQQRRYRPGHPLAVRATLAGLRHGGHDPCCRWERDGTLWWATGTPTGPALLQLVTRATDGELIGTAWGPGSDWVLDGLPALLGADDNPEDFTIDPAHAVLTRSLRSHPGVRVMRTRRVFDAFAAACLEQRVTGQEAFFGWRRLALRFGELAPGPAAMSAAGSESRPHPAAGMRLPPTPQAWRSIPNWEWLQAGVDLSRRRALLGGAAVAAGLERTVQRPVSEVDGLLRRLPGVGRWTSAEVRQRAHGDPDAFSFGDFHVAKNVSYALTGVVMDDDRCAEVIAGYAGHRYRVQQLVGLAGVARPRRGPRMTLPQHTPTKQRIYRPATGH